MKKLILLTILLSNVALANSKSLPYSAHYNNETQISGTHYSNIYNRMLDADAGSYYREAGSLWSGRCFTRANPNTPIAAALLFKNRDDGSGPVGRNEVAAASIWNLNTYPEYYDRKSPYEVGRVNYVTAIYDRYKNSYYLYLNNGTKTAIRRDRQYIYEAVLNNQDQTEAICYYFIKNY